MLAHSRLFALVALVALVGGCDSDASSSHADARTGMSMHGTGLTDAPSVGPLGTADSDLTSTVVPIPADGIDFGYGFSGEAWTGSFTATSLDAKGNAIVTFSERRVLSGSAESRQGQYHFANSFSWPNIEADADVRYLARQSDGTFAELAIVPGVDGEDGETRCSGRSYHRLPNGITRVDYPCDGDPADEIEGETVTSTGEEVGGLTDIEVRFAPDIEMPEAVAVRFTYPKGVKFSHWPLDPGPTSNGDL